MFVHQLGRKTRASAQTAVGTCGGVTVWSHSENKPSLQRRSSRQPEVSLFCGENWLQLFTSFYRGLSPNQKRNAVASECDPSGNYSYWQARPLVQVFSHLAQSWLPALLESEQVVAHLQPIACPRTRAVYGFEALARAHVDGKLINGGELVEAAGAHFQTQRFDQVARRAAAKSAANHLQNSEQIFINIFPENVDTAEVDLQDLWQSLREHDWSPENTIIEIVESTDDIPTSKLQEIIRVCRSGGCRVALDDVGLGHSTLNQARELLPDLIKLDRSLIPASVDDPAVPVVRAMVEFAHDLGIEVVLEGVETSQHLEVALEMKADLVQGWYVGRPCAIPQRIVCID